MRKLLTIKEVAYLDQLIERNRKLRLKSELSRPLHTPMTNSERLIRARIRRKTMIGVIDLLKIRASGVDSVSEINNALQLVYDKTLNFQEKKIRDAILENGWRILSRRLGLFRSA